MSDPRDRPFSPAWTAAAFGIFFAVELTLGGGVAALLRGRHVSHMLGLRVDLLLSLLSFLVGGFVVGAVSPGRRLLEPAVGAAITVVATFLLAWFTPVSFIAMAGGRMFAGALLAFLVALFGAHWGEKLTGN